MEENEPYSDGRGKWKELPALLMAFLAVAFGAGVEGALRAYLPKKAYG